MLNYLYVDTWARENVLQQKIEPDCSYTITLDYRLCLLPCSQFYTIRSFKLIQENPLLSLHSNAIVSNDVLCKITGINYYGLIKQYQKIYIL